MQEQTQPHDRGLRAWRRSTGRRVTRSSRRWRASPRRWPVMSSNSVSVTSIQGRGWACGKGVRHRRGADRDGYRGAATSRSPRRRPQRRGHAHGNRRNHHADGPLCRFSAALNGLFLAKEVFAARNLAASPAA